MAEENDSTTTTTAPVTKTIEANNDNDVEQIDDDDNDDEEELKNNDIDEEKSNSVIDDNDDEQLLDTNNDDDVVLNENVDDDEDNDNNDQQQNDVELIDLSNDEEDEEDDDNKNDQQEDDSCINTVDDDEDEDGEVNDKEIEMIENGEESDSKAFDDDDEVNDEDQVENIDQDNEMIDSINGDSSSINQMITNDDGLQSAAANASITDEIMISDGEIDGDDEDDDGNENENDEGMIVTDPAASTTSKNNDVVSKLNSNSFDKPQNLVSKSSSKNNQSLINNNNKITEEIVIDDDEDEDVIDDEDEVQDLSTNKSTTKHVKEQQPQEQEMKQEDNSSNNNNNNEKTSIEDLIPKLSDELTGFPKFFQNVLTLGDCIAINKKSRSDIDIDKDYSILDCPSQVVPLIIKRANKFPPKLKTETSDQTTGQKPPPPPPSQSNQQSNNTKNMLTISDFYSSSVGKFLMGIGLSRVKQWYHKDAINKVRKQIRKEGDAEDLMEELKKQQEYLTSCRVANASYIFPTIKCEHCDFRSEFQSVIQNHMAYPHQTSRKELKCNYCQFSTRDSKVIIDHVQCMHERKCLIELPPQLYECPICPYESGVKSKAATHIAKCLKFFLPEKLLANKDDYFPTITPKPITQEDIKIYEATLQALRFAALNPQTKVPQIAGLPPGLQQQMYLVQQQQMNRIAPSGRNKKHHHHHHQQSAQPFDAHQAHSHPQQQQQQAQSSIMAHSSSSSSSHKMNRHNNASNLAANANQMALHYRNAAAPQLYNMLANTQIAAQLFQNAAAAGLPNALSLLNKPHMLAKLQNITPPGTVSGLSATHQPHHSSSRHNTSSNSKSSIISNKHHHHAQQQQQQQPNNLTVGAATVANNPKGSFVMCEICDGYIKDLEQLRTHMQWIHKVRIHPKMLASRPPLNCQKCQWRFFTDQGLERHLLGSHGLVTSNMQEMVNRNEDGGRCTICGRVFTSKLVTHMNQAHKINLKPAHLSYKCTVCSATFNLYRLFENHVYMVHSGSVKRNTNSADNETTMPPRKKAALDMSANGN